MHGSFRGTLLSEFPLLLFSQLHISSSIVLSTIPVLGSSVPPIGHLCYLSSLFFGKCGHFQGQHQLHILFLLVLSGFLSRSTAKPYFACRAHSACFLLVAYLTYSLSSKIRSRTFPRNVSKILMDYTVSYARR